MNYQALADFTQFSGRRVKITLVLSQTNIDVGEIQTHFSTRNFSPAQLLQVKTHIPISPFRRKLLLTYLTLAG